MRHILYAAQMTTYTLYSARLLIRARWALVKSRELYRGKGAICYAGHDYYTAHGWGFKRPLSISDANRKQGATSSAPCTPYIAEIPAGMSQGVEWGDPGPGTSILCHALY